MSRDTFHRCHYARKMKANPLDDGIGDTMVSSAFDDITFISHGKRVNLRTQIKESISNVRLEMGMLTSGLRGYLVGCRSFARSHKGAPRRRRSYGTKGFFSRSRPTTLTVLLLHGFPTSSRTFRSLMPAQSDRYGPCVAAVDGNKAASPLRAIRRPEPKLAPGGRARNEAARPFSPGPRKTPLSSFASPGLGVPLP